MPRRPTLPITLNLEIRKRKNHFISSSWQKKRNLEKIKEHLAKFNNYLKTYGKYHL
jgi:hypothetical protein